MNRWQRAILVGANVATRLTKYCPSPAITSGCFRRDCICNLGKAIILGAQTRHDDVINPMSMLIGSYSPQSGRRTVLWLPHFLPPKCPLLTYITRLSPCAPWDSPIHIQSTAFILMKHACQTPNRLCIHVRTASWRSPLVF